MYLCEYLFVTEETLLARQMGLSNLHMPAAQLCYATAAHIVPPVSSLAPSALIHGWVLPAGLCRGSPMVQHLVALPMQLTSISLFIQIHTCGHAHFALQGPGPRPWAAPSTCTSVCLCICTTRHFTTAPGASKNEPRVFISVWVPSLHICMYTYIYIFPKQRLQSR